MKGIEPPSLTDYVRRSLRLLRRDKGSCRHHASVDVLLFHFDSKPVQLGCNITTSPLTIVGEKEEG